MRRCPNCYEYLVETPTERICYSCGYGMDVDEQKKLEDQKKEQDRRFNKNLRSLLSLTDSRIRRF